MEDLILEGGSRSSMSSSISSSIRRALAGTMGESREFFSPIVGGSSNSGSNSNANAASLEKLARMKQQLWDKSSVEPAMLRAPIVVIIFIFLWGLNLVVLEKSKLQYHNALSIKTAPISFAFMWAFILLALFLVSITVLSNVLDYQIEYTMTIFYLFGVAAFFIPFIPYQDTKSSFFRLLRNCVFPVDKIAFSEVLLADALTSLSKVFKDFGVTLISIFAVMTHQSVIKIHNEAMIVIAIMASAPFFIRVRQCMVQLEGAQDFYSRLPIILNIIKYMTGFPPIWLAAIAGLGYEHPMLPMIIAVMAAINSIYSFLWDIIMDWGFILTNRDLKIWIRNKLYYSVLFFVFATIINFILRFSWYANRLTYFKQLHSSHLLLIVEIAEVFRRSMWNMFRIEWEVHDKLERSSSRDKDDFENIDK